jgi:hypothetical protein
MGDRAISEVKLEKGSIYIYTHWGGFDLPKVAQEAIVSAEPRWDDEPYAAHIIIDQLIKEGRDSETGIGIMLEAGAEDEYNNDSPSAVIDIPNRTLKIIGHDEEDGKWTFAKVVKLVQKRKNEEDS